MQCKSLRNKISAMFVNANVDFFYGFIIKKLGYNSGQIKTVPVNAIEMFLKTCLKKTKTKNT